MKKALVVLGILLALLLIAGVIADLAYHAVLPSPVVTHADVATETTAVRMLIEPERGREFLQRYVEGTSVPAWSVDYVLPREIAMMLSPELLQKEMDATVFVNERRLGPVIVRAMNRAEAMRNLLGVTWAPEGLELRGRGRLVMEGAYPLSDYSVGLVESTWGRVMQLTPLTLEGGHFAEVVVDLRDGRGFVFLSELLRTRVPQDSPLHPSSLVTLLYKTTELRLFVDVDGPDIMKLRLRMKCRPDLTEEDAQSLAFLLSMIQAEIQSNLQEAYGVELSGKAEAEGLVVSGDYELRNYGPVLELFGL